MNQTPNAIIGAEALYRREPRPVAPPPEAQSMGVPTGYQPPANTLDTGAVPADLRDEVGQFLHRWGGPLGAFRWPIQRIVEVVEDMGSATVILAAHEVRLDDGRAYSSTLGEPPTRWR